MATLRSDDAAYISHDRLSFTFSSTEIHPSPPSPLSAEELYSKLTTSLLPQLSFGASINAPGDEKYAENTARWSDHTTTNPAAVINVACEEDICAVVKFATSHNIPFLAQTGGHGNSSWIPKLASKQHLIINLRPMNNVTVSLPSGTAKIQGGAVTKEVVNTAHAAKAHIVTGTCNGVGIVSVLLGGGLGNLVSLYGLGVDNILSARLITSTGSVLNVSKDENEGLFWGVRGAGHQFGIVSELTVKAYKQVNGGVHWCGIVTFPGSKEMAGKVAGAIREMGLGKEMALEMTWARLPPNFQPMIILNLWYAGKEDDAKAAYQKLYALEPVMQQDAPTPYSQINAPNDDVCAKGGRKPTYSVALKEEEMEKVSNVWEQWEKWSVKEGCEMSVVLQVCYAMGVARENKEEMAFGLKGCGVHVLAALDYSDSQLDDEANAFGRKFRDTLQGDGERRAYTNFATGDEEARTLYGSEETVEKLRKLKREFDPKNVFGWYNPVR